MRSVTEECCARHEEALAAAAQVLAREGRAYHMAMTHCPEEVAMIFSEEAETGVAQRPQGSRADRKAVAQQRTSIGRLLELQTVEWDSWSLDKKRNQNIHYLYGEIAEAQRWAELAHRDMMAAERVLKEFDFTKSRADYKEALLKLEAATALHATRSAMVKKKQKWLSDIESGKLEPKMAWVVYDTWKRAGAIL